MSSDFLSSDLVSYTAHGVDIAIEWKCFIINYALSSKLYMVYGYVINIYIFKCT